MQIEITLPLHTHNGLQAIQYGKIDSAVDVESDGQGGWEVTGCYVYDLDRRVMVKVTEESLCKLIRTHAEQQCFDHIEEAYFTAYPRPYRDQNAEHQMAVHQFL